jgi:type I site-specific restriction endonuclease
MHCVIFYQLTLEEVQSQLQAEIKTLETLKGKGVSEAERRKHVTELEREQVWLEREQEIARVIEDVLQTGNSITKIK